MANGLKARGTTLGADGFGMASALAVLADDNYRPWPLEGAADLTEEAGMDGAFGLQSAGCRPTSDQHRLSERLDIYT